MIFNATHAKMLIFFLLVFQWFIAIFLEVGDSEISFFRIYMRKNVFNKAKLNIFFLFSFFN